MPTLVACTGFEHGSTAGLTTGNAGIRLHDGSSGSFGTTFKIQAGSARTGSYGLNINSAASGTSFARWDTNTVGTSKDAAIVTFAARVNSASGKVGVHEVTPASGSGAFVVYDPGTSQFGVQWGLAGATTYQAGTTATATWAVIDIRVSGMAGTTRVIDWYLNGVAQTQLTTSATASSLSQVTLGNSGVTPVSYDIDLDDWCVSVTSGDYPLGDHGVRVLSVDSADTVTLSGTTGNFNTFTSNGTLAAWNATTARNNIDEVPPTISASADGWVQITNATSDYVEMPLTSYTLAAGETVSGLRALVVGWATSTSAATIRFDAYNGTTAETFFAVADPNFDNSTSTPAWVCAMLTTANYDTQSELNALALRGGFSGDANPDIGVHAVYAELAVKSVTSASPNAEAATGTGTAYDATIPVSAESATGTGTAYDATVAITANAEAATATGTAANAVADGGTGTATATNTFEGGSDETTISTGNSGSASGTAFDAVSIGTGASLVFDTDHAAHGSYNCRVATGGTSTTSYVAWSTAVGTLSVMYGRAYLYFTANPGANHRIFTAVGAASTRAIVTLTTGGLLRSSNAAGSTIQTMTSAISLNQWIRVEWRIVGDASVGQVEVKLFNSPESTTATDTITSTADQNLGGTIDTYRFGVGSSVANVGPYWQDDLVIGTGGYLGPAVATSASAEAASGTGTAYDATVALEVNAEAASGTGTGYAATAALEVSAEAATATATAYDASVAATVNAEAATGTGTGYEPTVSTVNDVSASAEAATATATAYDATVALEVSAEAATGAGAAQDATAALEVSAEAATGAGAAQDATAALEVNAEAATATATAYDATVALEVNAELAAAVAAALDAVGDAVAPHVKGLGAASVTAAAISSSNVTAAAGGVELAQAAIGSVVAE